MKGLMRSSWVIWVSPNQKTHVLIETEEEVRGSWGHVKTRAKTGVMKAQAEEWLEPPEAGRGKEGFSPRGLRGGMPG